MGRGIYKTPDSCYLEIISDDCPVDYVRFWGTGGTEIVFFLRYYSSHVAAVVW